jgi:hypothetical protein
MNMSEATQRVAELVEEAADELELSHEESMAVEQAILSERSHPLVYLAPAVHEATHGVDELMDRGERSLAGDALDGRDELRAVAVELVREAAEEHSEVDL